MAPLVVWNLRSGGDRRASARLHLRIALPLRRPADGQLVHTDPRQLRLQAEKVWRRFLSERNGAPNQNKARDRTPGARGRLSQAEYLNSRQT
jgi:hypothetical protein